MTDATNATRPVRCTECRQPTDSPICCTSCGALNPQPLEGVNYFEMLNMPTEFDLDLKTLHREYLRLTRSIHPDAVGGDSSETREASLRLSSELNRAYETLKDPVSRAEYLLGLHQGAEAMENRSVPPEVLSEVMMLREEIEEAEASDDQEALADIRKRVKEHYNESLEAITNLTRSAGDTCPVTRETLRERLNVIKYWKNLLDQV
jgi:molecular chaperone HscB